MGNLSALFRLSAQWRHILRGMERGKVALSDLTLTRSQDVLAGQDLDDLSEEPNRLMALILRDFAAAGGKVDPEFLNHLASMFEGHARLKADVIRPKGGKSAKFDPWAIALDVEQRLRAGDKAYIAYAEAAAAAGCSARASRRYYREYLDALDDGDADSQ